MPLKTENKYPSFLLPFTVNDKYRAALKNQTYELPGTRQTGQTALSKHYDPSHPQIRQSVAEFFEAGLEISYDKPCLGHRPIISTNPVTYSPSFIWQTYREVDARRRNVGSALEHLWRNGQLGGGELPTVGIWAANCPEWQIVDLGCMVYGKVSTALFDSYGPDTVELILNHAEISILFTTIDHLPILIQEAHKLNTLRMIVIMNDLHPETERLAKKWITKATKIRLYTFPEFESIGKQHPHKPTLPTSDQVYTLCYTSGTTGLPRGAIITHGLGGLVVSSGVWGLLYTNEPGVCLSSLPLAHIYQRIIESAVFNRAGSIGYQRNNPLFVLEDLQVLKPTIWAIVPRVANRICQAIMTKVDVPGFKGDLFRKAYAAKLERLRTAGDFEHAIWDRIGESECFPLALTIDVTKFLQIRSIFGGNLKLVYIGSSAIPPVYGMTETFAVIARSSAYDPSGADAVGAPLPHVEIKLVDTPELGYTSNDKPFPRGELYARMIGLNKGCLGYYKDPESTKYTFDDEGWIHTGDIAELDECGRIKLIDRKRNITKLSNGLFVAIERIETLYGAAHFVQQLLLYGDASRDYLVAIIIPSVEYILQTLTALCVDVESVKQDQTLLESLLRSTHTNNEFPNIETQLKTALLTALDTHASTLGLLPFERIRNVYITLQNDMFSIERGTITPTLKIRRREAINMYKNIIERLYEEGKVSISMSGTASRLGKEKKVVEKGKL
ncbi:hypothetical protein Clacol_005274 [Clathrus columnatus]|uniref:AMP-dependent synthetase/ligase domain-containing protein n=1 Tax=Clathrus columnatus TaxID=1419009 RepID=A0AAV5AC35_9AGAM|nr:hypothetical protein Clacol_005274 [Clathrus columnatus]